MKQEKKILYSGFTVVYESSEKIIKLVSVCNRILQKFDTLILQYNDYHRYDLKTLSVKLPVEGYNEYSYITVYQYNEVLRELTESGQMDFTSSGLPNSTEATDVVMEMIEKESESRMTRFIFPQLSEMLIVLDNVYGNLSALSNSILLKNYYDVWYHRWNYMINDSIKTALVNGDKLSSKQMKALNKINKHLMHSENVNYFN